MGQNSRKNTVIARPQELEVGQQSGPYLLVSRKGGKMSSNFNGGDEHGKEKRGAESRHPGSIYH